MIERRFDLASFLDRVRSHKPRRLALASGVSRTQIYEMRNGKDPNPTAETIMRLNAAMDALEKQPVQKR